MKSLQLLSQTNSIKILINLSNKPNYMSKIKKEMDMCLNSTMHNIKYLKKLKLINEEKIGRVKILSLTKKGHLVAARLIELNSLVSC